MKILCPSCETVFKITDAQLKIADGYVQCGQCKEIFNALEQTQTPASPNHDLFEKESFDIETQTDDHNNLNSDPKALRQTLLGEKPHNPSDSFLWISCSFLLALILLAQYTYINRNQIVIDHPTLSPYISKACQAITGCTIQPKRDLNKIELVSRNIYTHPNIDGVLIINAVLANTANYTQPYPVLQVSMSNVRGKIIAQRYFQPNEYLAKGSTIKQGLAESTTTAINIEIIDPGSDALAFELDFY